MVFNSNVFLLAFFPVVYMAFWLLRSKQSRYTLLTISGYVFYGYWNWHFCFLLLFSSLVSYLAAHRVEAAKSKSVARAWMVGSIGIDLTLLGFFKYYSFGASSINAVFPGAHVPVLHIVLPIGISFYTFHTISYIADVAAGRIRATHDLFEYLAYVSLFSQLVAGPIVRFRQIEDDLEHIDGPPKEDMTARGIAFFVIGLVKKVIIADSLARLVDPLVSTAAMLDLSAAWAAALGYAFQLYYDFSGYSDMAVGLGLLFGVHIPQNFDAPYRAAGARDFWRRWHISLSSWLRDYLYIPLGGNRVSPLRTDLNLMVTMLLGGLWHGANWTFVAWGGYHGLLLIADRKIGEAIGRLSIAVYRAVTFVAVVIGWVLFRSPSLPTAITWLGTMFGLHRAVNAISAPSVLWLGCIACLLAVNIVPETWNLRLGTSRRWAMVCGIAFFVCYLFVNSRQTVFLYYQF